MAVYGPEYNEELYHYGIKRKSGRYPWGSGKEPYQSNPAMAKRAAAKKKPETFWEKRRKAQAAKQREKAKAVKAKTEAKEAKVNEAKPASQKAKEMSDEELVRAINRLRLEQTYLSMVEPPRQQNPQSQSQQQNNQQQQAKQQAQQIQNTVDNGKRWIDKMKSGTKDAADLATNIGNIAKGAQTTYVNVMSIKKMMNAAEELKKKKG